MRVHVCKKPLVALGANLKSDVGSPVQTLRAALGELADLGLTVSKSSRFFATPCFPAGAGPDYVNAVIEIVSEHDPRALLNILHQVEATFGRAREQRWGSRTLDLDLIAMGDLVLPTPDVWTHWHRVPADEQTQRSPDQLVLPHPRLQDRAFVLVPLADIAPDWVHPVLGRSVTQLLADLPRDDVTAVRPMSL